MNLMPTSEGDICALRIRASLFGRPVIQIRRKIVRHMWPREDGAPVRFEECGITSWRDASRFDTCDVASFLYADPERAREDHR